MLFRLRVVVMHIIPRAEGLDQNENQNQTDHLLRSCTYVMGYPLPLAVDELLLTLASAAPSDYSVPSSASC